MLYSVCYHESYIFGLPFDNFVVSDELFNEIQSQNNRNYSQDCLQHRPIY